MSFSQSKNMQKPSLTIQEIEELTGVLKATSSSFGAIAFGGVAALSSALSDQVTFFNNLTAEKELQNTQAGACFIQLRFCHLLPKHTIPLVTENPYRAFIILANVFLPKEKVAPMRHETAIIHATAVIHESCHISAGVIIESGAVVGPKCYVGPYTVIGSNVTLGNDCRIDSHVSLCNTNVGHRVHIKTGARIGQVGFGFLLDEKECIEIPHVGIVLLENDVQIGANCTIDRGSFQNTVIGEGSRIDNLVQIAHNVIIGKKVIIVAQTGISGSCIVGDGCILGGQVGLSGHLSIAAGTRIAAKSGVIRSNYKKEDLAGYPAIPSQQWRKQVVLEGFRRKKTLKETQV